MDAILTYVVVALGWAVERAPRPFSTAAARLLTDRTWAYNLYLRLSDRYCTVTSIFEPPLVDVYAALLAAERVIHPDPADEW